jgi:hypothetical protein
MFKSARQLHKLVKRGLLIPSADFDVEKLPNGQHRVHLRKKLISTAMAVTASSVRFSGVTFCAYSPCLTAHIFSEISINDVDIPVIDQIYTGTSPGASWVNGDESSLDLTARVLMTSYVDDDCSGGTFGTTNYTAQVHLSYSAGTWTVVLDVNAPDEFSPGDFTLFSGSGTSMSFSNTLSACDAVWYNPPMTLATGGTVTITP